MRSTKEDHNSANEIDVYDLGWQERKTLLKRLVRVAEEDNEMLLLKLKNHVDRVGIDLPTIAVQFEHINIKAEAFVENNALPIVVNFTIRIVDNFLNYMGILSSRKKQLTILNDVSGIIKSGNVTLLLGPPSSGKTILLLALAGKLDPALKCSGRVTYNGHDMDEIMPQRIAIYISQHDIHIREMTIRETLAFSIICQGVGSHYEVLTELSRREKQENIKPNPDVDFFMKKKKKLRKLEKGKVKTTKRRNSKFKNTRFINGSESSSKKLRMISSHV
ncbi:hypothetical protein CRYUN_Cryun34aG0080400 [Craigia yunnanensis]